MGELISKAEVERCGDKQLPVLSMTMHDGIVRQRERFKKSIASKDTSNYKVVYPQQLVVGFPIDEGVIYVQNFDEPGIMSPAYNVWDVDIFKVHPAYLELALHSPQIMTYYKVQMKGTTARRRTLSTDKLRDIKVPLPPIGKQVEIVARFHCVKELMRVCDEQTSSLDALVKSRFVEMFGGSSLATRTIGELATDIRYGTSKKSSDEGRYTYLRMNNMTDDGRLDFADTKRITLDGSELDKCLVHKGDLLFNRTNSREKVGKTAVFEEDEPMVIAGYIIRVRLVPDIRSRYLCAYMNLPHVKEQLRAMAKGAVHQANINAKQLGTIQVPVPRISQQDEFISFVSRVDKLRFVVIEFHECRCSPIG